jgi:hypothetical protein
MKYITETIKKYNFSKLEIETIKKHIKFYIQIAEYDFTHRIELKLKLKKTTIQEWNEGENKELIKAIQKLNKTNQDIKEALLQKISLNDFFLIEDVILEKIKEKYENNNSH